MKDDQAPVAATVPAQDLRTLLALDYDEFVECAYLTILNRPADTEGLAHFVARLRVGHPKVAILAALYGSSEARSADVHIPWMKGAVVKYKLSRLPLIRLIFGRIKMNQNTASLELEHRIHLLEQQIDALTNQTRSRLMELEKLIRTAAAPVAVSKHVESGQETPERTISNESLIAKRVHSALIEAIADEREDPTHPD